MWSAAIAIQARLLRHASNGELHAEKAVIASSVIVHGFGYNRDDLIVAELERAL